MVISVAIEAKGARLVPLMLDAIAAATAGDVPRLTALLCRFTDGLQDLTSTLKRMYEKNDPQVFFHQLRPFLAGSKNMAAAGLPHGVFYELGDGQGEWHQYSGGSNAQSSLIQTFDIFLGVSHSATGGTSMKSSGTSYIQVSEDNHHLSINTVSIENEHADSNRLTGYEKLHARSAQALPGDTLRSLQCPVLRDLHTGRVPSQGGIQCRCPDAQRLPRRSHPDCLAVYHHASPQQCARGSAYLGQGQPGDSQFSD